MSWSEERVELLKKLWAEGLSASVIAKRLTGTTRNAVISKVHREGLPGRGAGARAAQGGRTAQRNRRRREGQVKSRKSKPNPAWRMIDSGSAQPYEELDIPIGERKTLQDLEPNDCRWPIGDPQMPEFHFCNRSKIAGLPYCELHARRAFQPPELRQPRARMAPVSAGGDLRDAAENQPAPRNARERAKEDA